MSRLLAFVFEMMVAIRTDDLSEFLLTRGIHATEICLNRDSVPGRLRISRVRSAASGQFPCDELAVAVLPVPSVLSWLEHLLAM